MTLTIVALGVSLLTATPAFVQGNSERKLGISLTSSTSLALPTQAGNLLILTITHDNTANQVTAIADTDGNQYQQAIAPVAWNDGTYRTEMWYAKNIAGSGSALSTTVTFSAAAGSFVLLYLNEYSGIDRTSPLDQTAAVAATAPQSVLDVSSGSKPISARGELIFGHGEAQGPEVFLGSGFALRSNSFGNIEEDLIAPNSGQYAAEFSLDQGGPYLALMATFLPLSEAPDGGITNDGVPDFGDPRRFFVGCGCTGAESALLPAGLLAAAFAMWRNRSRSRRGHR